MLRFVGGWGGEVAPKTLLPHGAMAMTAEPELVCQWCGQHNNLALVDYEIKVANPQVEFDHNIHRCDACAKLTACRPASASLRSPANENNSRE